MSQGLFTAASGIATNQSALNVIADNIANINTVAFKSSQINFETIFTDQLSAGSAPSSERGGINPMEIGLGVTVAEVGRNFSNGSVQTTGRTTDLSIQGDGFFALSDVNMNASGATQGQIFLTRAGNFSMDANGYLVTPNGYYVVGTENTASTTGGSNCVQIPIKLNFVTPDAIGTDSITNIGQESGSAVTNGTFSIRVSDGTDSEYVSVTVSPTDTLSDVVANMQAAILSSAYDDGNTVVSLATGANGEMTIDVDTTADIISFGGQSTDTSNFLSVVGISSKTATTGTLTYSVDGTGGTVNIDEDDTLSEIATNLQAALRATDGDNTITVSVSNGQLVIDTTTDSEVILLTGGTSDFSTITNLQGAAATGYNVIFDSESADLKDQSQVVISDPDNSDDTRSVTTYYIGNDGSMEVTYSNGAKLSVTGNNAGTRELQYTSANGRVITGSDNIDNTSTVVPAQLQLQVATVINPKGLNVVGGNLFSLNSIAGEPSFAIPGTGGLGIVKAGSLEASNVDLPSEFSNMILSQRAIEANSRAFSTVNEILRTIVNLGR